MTTALYRINGGEVIKISTTNQPFTEVDPLYFAVLTDPAFPDGIDIRDPGGNLRVLGYAKFADPSGGGTVRNATQPEIDAWPAAQTADENLQDKSGGQELFNNHPRYRKVFKAMLKEFAEEFDRTRVNPKAQMSIINNNTGQLMTAGVWEDIVFAGIGEDTVSHDSLTSDIANNRIQLDQRGRHLVMYHMTIEGDDNSEFIFDISRNGSRTDRLRSRVKLMADGTRPQNVSVTGILHFPDAPPNYITLSCRNTMGTDRNLIVRECQVVITRNENRAKRPHGDLQIAIDNQFSEDD